MLSAKKVDQKHHAGSDASHGLEVAEFHPSISFLKCQRSYPQPLVLSSAQRPKASVARTGKKSVLQDHTDGAKCAHFSNLGADGFTNRYAKEPGRGKADREKRRAGIGKLTIACSACSNPWLNMKHVVGDNDIRADQPTQLVLTGTSLVNHPSTKPCAVLISLMMVSAWPPS